MAEWRERALSETNPRAALTALLALARVGTKDDLELILKALARFPLDSLSDELKLDKLRVIEVALARQGRPGTDALRTLGDELSRQYPAKTFALNRELCALLVWLTRDDSRSGDAPVPSLDAQTANLGAGAPRLLVLDKTLALIDASTEPAEQVWFALCLREASGWTPLQREHYFAWFAKARTYRGGNSFGKFILRIRDQALEKVPAAERSALLALSERDIAVAKPAAPMPVRPFVKAWTLADLAPALDGVAKGRDFKRGERLYGETLCAQCHLFAGKGGDARTGAIGPDLTAVGSRFSRRDVLEAILDPSKVISEQYASYLFTFTDGTSAAGQVAEENHYLLTLIVDPLTGARQNFPKGKLKTREMSPASLMPPGLIYSLSPEEVLDLLAYMESGGNPKAPNFAK
ncbi:MAG: c-type cytochrome [Chthoniobacteraceae bacterium]